MDRKFIERTRALEKEGRELTVSGDEIEEVLGSLKQWLEEVYSLLSFER